MPGKIIIDAMGGDFAPSEIIKGAYDAYKKFGCEIVLVGIQEKIEKSASDNGINLDFCKVVHASQEIEMNDHPSEVLRKKKDSSIFKGTLLLSEEKNSAFISAGNTGAVMACSILNNKRIEGILRPAIAVVIPLADKKIVLIDSGSNADCKPQYLKQFALMGRIFCENILNINNPRIGLINVGSEENKGNEMSVEAHKLLKNEKSLNFIGNIEGRDVFNGIADVAVCDGFTGNILLKSIEGIANLFFSEIKRILKSSFASKLSALILKKSFKEMKKKFDYEETGGAFLIGVNGIVIISHGSSKAKAVFNAVRVAIEGQNSDIIEKISREIINF